MFTGVRTVQAAAVGRIVDPWCPAIGHRSHAWLLAGSIIIHWIGGGESGTNEALLARKGGSRDEKLWGTDGGGCASNRDRRRNSVTNE